MPTLRGTSRGSGDNRMSTTEPEPRDVNTRTVQLVKALTEVGPDIPEISKILGQFRESVRYRYKEKILNKGFAVQAAVDHEKLGLRRMVVVLDFAAEYRKYGGSILASMNELCFLVSFARTMPQGLYVADFSVPIGFAESMKKFLLLMKEKGMFLRLDILDLDYYRMVPMKAEFYDFDTGRWDFDWADQSTQGFGAASYTPSTPVRFDQVDLLIVKELQIDANKTLKEISDKIKVNYKKLSWHYITHVQGKRMLRGYSVNWMGTKYDYALERALHRQHRYFALQLIARNLTEFEMIALRSHLDRLPFVWAEAYGKDYEAQLAFPVDSVVEGIQYLTGALASIRDRADIHMIDQTSAARFTIPYNRYDQAGNKWTFDDADLVRRFESLLIQIKEGTS